MSLTKYYVYNILYKYNTYEYIFAARYMNKIKVDKRDYEMGVWEVSIEFYSMEEV